MERSYSANDLSRAFAVSKSTAYRIMRSIEHTYIGRSIRVSESALRDAIKDNGGRLPTSRKGRESQDGR